jgi:oxygen-independent coproporphyrinogen-3 oxidase
MTHVSSLYLHVPFCKHLCNYCDFYKKLYDPSSNQIEDFHQFLQASDLKHELLLKEHHQSWGRLDTVYLGGGTPSLWGAAGADFFAENFLKKGLASNVEFTMEVDPGTWSVQMLEAWKKIGLNRISIGTQSLNPDFLKVLDRAHSVEESYDLLRYLQKENWNFSLDFLLGVPYSLEKKRVIRDELDGLLQYEPKHISLYILNARSKYPHIQQMPDDEYIREEYLFVSEYLKSKGFHHYEVSNFALPGYESRHNQKYWRGESVMAIGPTGTGYLKISEDSAVRYKWKVTKAEYELEELSRKDLDLESTYLSLRTSDGWKPNVGSDELIKIWVEKKYCEVNDAKVKLTSLGYVMLDSLMNDLFLLKS